MDINDSSVSLSLPSDPSEKIPVHKARLLELFDQGSFTQVSPLMGTHEHRPVDSLICGFGKINGRITFAFSQHGEISTLHSKKMLNIYTLAEKAGAPLIGIYDSNGVDLTAGVGMLNICGDILLKKVEMLEAIPQISLILGPCIGSNAVVANSADFIIMSGGGSLFASPPNFDESAAVGTTISAAKAGLAHIITENENSAIAQARSLISLLCIKEEGYEVNENYEYNLGELTHSENPNINIVVENVFDKNTSVSLLAEFGDNIVTAMARLKGRTVGIVGSASDGLTSDDCEKIARITNVWNRFNIPIINLINTVGISSADPLAIQSITKLSLEYIRYSVAKITLIMRKAYASGYIAFCSPSAKNSYVGAWPNAVITPLPPHAAVAFLKGDVISQINTRQHLEEKYISEAASAKKMAEDGVINQVVMPEHTRDYLINMLGSLGL